ncbi:hypothetical protein CPB84DRAFT_1852536 [Gymnopilus junonius]|uniref:Uncharacterized protein n=1 Tax=Gymnopilus junonius TaxID=109634 RepID=A0A9P5NAY1_GYMJU|nr:hypothetical protein CPB84DRAFT_1852536 [Gymnopilus junonius]
MTDSTSAVAPGAGAGGAGSASTSKETSPSTSAGASAVPAAEARPSAAAIPGETGEKVKYVRITTHGKMKTWIANSLLFFEDLDEEKSVVFHTLPTAIDPSTYPSSSSPQPAERSGGGKDTSKPSPAPNTSITITSKAASSTTDLIPRLLSVVEILKREFMKKLEEKRSPRMKGLEQYNELGSVEALRVTVSDVAVENAVDDAGKGQGQGQEEAEKQRSERILQALSGKNYPRQSQTPYMRITLSLAERPDLVERGATYISTTCYSQALKSGKARAKKRAKKAQVLALEEAKKAIGEASAEPAASTAAPAEKKARS